MRALQNVPLIFTPLLRPHRHYCIRGPEDSPYVGGYYHGKILFPKDYPYKPPGIMMVTPSGRFQTNTRLCLSLSDFHPDTWHPAWSVSSILIGLLSFMLENTPTAGSVETTDTRKKILAQKSLETNLANVKFVKLFPEIADEITKKLNDRYRLQGSSSIGKQSSKEDSSKTKQRGSDLIANVILLIIIIIFVWVVSRIIEEV
ncbi:hypothetical protein SARC_07903 [Sphaeroforma arctica JP610]|uniref:UBC core domain-containing protein n=1 Tax=Sphaeroforma arctica JP610 TaxID=667725 RepID=A0A0L0FSP8_9EUKA|nr:hypothetical protein SARC_07903 [Sphaeroforma arctica JP610]KNC79709.1 hypothetical protein SARC_07903 [Sphaeroforma arctica JP610]|eukprot:XP_014153611.1 hypothetical protein SARC_07903 [Sphaeroforma arctica JP610]